MVEAVKCGYFHIVKMMIKSMPKFFTVEVMQEAIKYNDFKIIKWIHKHVQKISYGLTIDYAAANGHLKIIKWLYKNNIGRCSSRAIELAAKYNHAPCRPSNRRGLFRSQPARTSCRHRRACI